MANSESEIERKRNIRIENLYKNLEYVSHAYHQAEGTFPFWEAAFALIVGQLVIAFFTPGVCVYQQKLLAIGGIFISLTWFILVSLNLKNAQYMDSQIIILEDKLDQELKAWSSAALNNSPNEFIKPWARRSEKEKWNWFGNILLGNEPHNKELWNCRIWLSKMKNIKKTIEELIYVSKSTWLWRRLLPFLLIWSWSYLLIIC
jgi:hypothetical protein